MSSDHARPRTPTKEENGIRNQERPINSQRDNRDKEYREKDLRDKNPSSNYRRESKDLKDYREYRGDRDRDFRDRDREYRSRRENERSPRERDFRDGKDMRAHRDNAPRNPPNYQKNPQTTQTTQPPPPIHPPPPPPAEEEKMEGFNPNAPRKARWGSRSVDIFQKLEQIGEGTYGKVYMAKNKHTGETVALKKVRMANEKEGFPITAIREIKILKELHHENVVQLKEIVTSKATSKGKAGIYMVFEYMDHDLTGLMLNEGRQWRPSQAQIKCYMKQLLEGLHYCHSNNVLHRDIKGSNLLLDNNGRLKLADFGLARPYTDQQSNSYTNRVITLWYRPPELLLGAVQYGPAIDMWSVGCILTELLIGKAIFPGRSEIDQLESIFKVCGTPTHENWPDVDKLSWWHMFKPQKDIKRNLKETITKIAGYAIPKEALDLIDKLLTLDPKKRISAADALDNDYFWTPPAPAKASELPKFPSCHEYQAKKRRMQNSQPQAEPRMDRDVKRQKGPTGAPVSQYQSHPQQPQPFHSQQQQFHPQQKSNNGAVPTNAPQQQPRQPNNPNRYSLNQQPQPQQQQQRSKPYGMNMNRV